MNEERHELEAAFMTFLLAVGSSALVVLALLLMVFGFW